jgi:hypothetical protein
LNRLQITIRTTAIKPKLKLEAVLSFCCRPLRIRGAAVRDRLATSHARILP